MEVIMNHRYLKPAGQQISLLGFGTMRLPMLADCAGQIDEAEAIRMIRHAIDSGVNYVDTAYMYHDGKSEDITGKALKDGYREKVLLADKMPVWLAKSEEDLDRILDEQLARLGTDCIDMYLIHAISESVWARALKFNIFGFLEKKRAEGKIRFIGFSFHDELPLFKTVIDAYAWDFCQIQLNYMDIKFQAGVAGLNYAGEKNIPVIVMEPLKGGKLTDALPDSIAAIWNSADIKRSPAEWALRWVANFPQVLTILSGMSSMVQLEENLAILKDAAPGSLTDQEVATIEKVSDEYNRLTKVSCTSCRYCMPCPARLSIPTLLNHYNEWFLYGKNPKVIADFYMFTPEKLRPSACTGCRACEEKCPQHLPISDLMKDIAEAFEKK
jgi:hypothetical protein